jgi:hypothetical protein
MDNVKEINIHIPVPRIGRRGLLLLLTLFFLCWHPGFIGSETLTLTTYYPAPYGGYVSILTTGQTILARDSGSVGIRNANPNPAYALDVNGAIEWSGSQLNTDQNGSIELGQNGGGTPFIDFHYGGGGDYNVRLINYANQWMGLYGNLYLANNGSTITGNNMTISGLCQTVGMGSGGWTYCPAGENLVNVNYTSSINALACVGVYNGYCVAGNTAVPAAGTMLCCRIY